MRGELYMASDPELQAAQAWAQGLLEHFNRTAHNEQPERDRILRELLGELGEGTIIKPAFRCDYGAPIRIGANTFINYDCVMLDVAPITIGSY